MINCYCYHHLVRIQINCIFTFNCNIFTKMEHFLLPKHICHHYYYFLLGLIHFIYIFLWDLEELFILIILLSQIENFLFMNFYFDFIRIYYRFKMILFDNFEKHLTVVINLAVNFGS